MYHLGFIVFMRPGQITLWFYFTCIIIIIVIINIRLIMSDSNMRTRHSSFGHIGQWWVGWRNQRRHLSWLWKINWKRLMKLIKRDEPGHCLGPHQSHKCQADWRILFNNIHFPHFTFNEQLMYSENLVRLRDTLDNIHRNGHWRK